MVYDHLGHYFGGAVCRLSGLQYGSGVHTPISTLFGASVVIQLVQEEIIGCDPGRIRTDDSHTLHGPMWCSRPLSYGVMEHFTNGGAEE